VTKLNPKSATIATSCKNGVGVGKVAEALGLKVV